MSRGACLRAVILGVALVGGCVERSYVVETNPPGALVMANNRPLGAAPADGHWVYPGKYDFTIYKPGFETLHVEQLIEARWYDYPPLDFFADHVWPFKLVDRRRFRYDLVPAQVPDVNDVLQRSGGLRDRGRALRPEAAPASPPASLQEPVPTMPPVPNGP